MTSVDSGVETGNDSNDSGQTEAQVLFAAPSTSAIKRGKVQEVKKSPEDVKEPEILENIESSSSTAMVCVNQSSPLALHFLSEFPPNNYEYRRARTFDGAPQHFQEKSWVLSSNACLQDKNASSLLKPSNRCLTNWVLARKLRNEMRGARRMNRSRVDMYEGQFTEKRMRIAAGTNNVELLTRLLKKGVSPNNTDDQGRSPLHLACATGYPEIVKLLLDYGADPNMTDTLGNTPLHLAAVTSKTALVVLLLKAGTNVMSFDRHGYSPLQLAQTKLRMLQKHQSAEIGKIKEEVHKVVEMLLAYFDQQKNVSVQMETLNSLCSRLSLSNTTHQIQDDLKDLLANVESLSLSRN